MHAHTTHTYQVLVVHWDDGFVGGVLTWILQLPKYPGRVRSSLGRCCPPPPGPTQYSPRWRQTVDPACQVFTVSVEQTP